MAWKKALAIVFWLLLWQLASGLVSSPILLASPLAVAVRLFQLAGTANFWKIMLTSGWHILLGFGLGVGIGTLLAALSCRLPLVERLLSPLLATMKAIPVASFILLVLVWTSSRYISTIISFLVVLPMAYVNSRAGLTGTDHKLLEMADLFQVGWLKRWQFLYWPALFPHLAATINVGVGFAFKSGVAAEVIGLTRLSMGYALYQAKITLETVDVFAWTAVIVLLSILCENGVHAVMHYLERKTIG